MHCMLMDLLHGFEVLSTTEETLFNYHRLLLSLKINLIYRLPILLLLYILLSPIKYRDKRFFMHAVF